MGKSHSTALKDSLSKMLIYEGYPSYAIALSRLDVTEKDFPGVAYIYNNKEIILSTNTLKQGDRVISLVTRHELLHNLLNHTERVKAIPNVDFRRFNAAADFELSNYYSSEDAYTLETYVYLKGACSVTLDEFKKYKDLTAEEVYDLLEKDMPDSKVEECLQEGGEEESSESSGTDNSEILEGIKQDVEKIEKIILNKTKAQQLEDNVISGRVVYDAYHEIFFDIESEYKDILRRKKVRSYTKENEIYVDHNVIFPSRVKRKRKDLTLHIFRDVSGSMTADKTDKAVQLVTKLSDNKNVTTIENYFSDQINKEIGGGTNYDAIIQYCKRKEITDIVIITDDDGNNIVTDYFFNKVFVIGVQGCSDTLTNLKANTVKHYTI